MTGGWQLVPSIQRNSQKDKILEHPQIVLWVSQNPIYINNPKYMAFPYGICHTSLKEYGHSLLTDTTNKPLEILLAGVNRTTNICRTKLPVRDQLPILEFYEKIAKSKFVISPVGDRDDCYRHYESIGLAAIPISNVSDEHKAIFGNSMHYCDIEKMVDIVSNDRIECEYNVPNKDLVCFDYHKDALMARIKSIKDLEV